MYVYDVSNVFSRHKEADGNEKLYFKHIIL